MAFVASVGLIVIGLMIVNLDDSPPDIRIFGWILFAVGVFGLLTAFVISRAGRDQDRRGRPREPGPPPQR